MNHPAHHALNAVLKTVRKQYKIRDGKYHMFGFLDGCRPATTYSRMSKQYIKSLTWMSSEGWQAWPDDELAKFGKTPPLHFVAAKDRLRREMAERVQKVCQAKGIAAQLEIVDGASATLRSLRGEDLLRKIKAHSQRDLHK